MSPRALCAIMIWEAWKHVHWAEPGPKAAERRRRQRPIGKPPRAKRVALAKIPWLFGGITSKRPPLRGERICAPSGGATSLRQSDVG
jgi:hypothetical protein